MDQIRQLQKKYCSTSLSIAIITGFIFILCNMKPVGKGLILGSIFSIINFILIGETLPAKLIKSKKKTFFLSLGSIYFRYAIISIPIFLGIKYDQFNLISVIIGIFSIQIIIILDNIFLKNKDRKNNSFK
jgi:hypothetical protein